MNRLSKQVEGFLTNLPTASRLCRHLLTNPEHRRRIEQIARRQTSGTSIAWEDAVQAAYLKLLQGVEAGKFRLGEEEEFLHWAVTVARFEIIDLVRQHNRQRCVSLDQTQLGSETTLIDTIADDFDTLATVERTDLVLCAIQAITDLDQQYPDRGYLKLWQGRVAGKTQTQLAAELGVPHQGAISKRWQELLQRVAETLDLQEPPIAKAIKTVRSTPKPARSDQQW